MQPWVNTSSTSAPANAPSTSIMPGLLSKQSTYTCSGSSTACPSSDEEAPTPRNSPTRGTAAAAHEATRRKSQQQQHQEARKRSSCDGIAAQLISSATKVGSFGSTSSTAAAIVNTQSGGGSGSGGGGGGASASAAAAAAATATTAQNAGGSEAKKSLVSMLCQSLWPMASVCTYRCKFLTFTSSPSSRHLTRI